MKTHKFNHGQSNTPEAISQDLISTRAQSAGTPLKDGRSTAFGQDDGYYSSYIEGQRTVERATSAIRLLGLFGLAVVAVAWRESCTRLWTVGLRARRAMDDLPLLLTNDSSTREIYRLVRTARRDPLFQLEMQSICFQSGHAELDSRHPPYRR